MLYIQSNNGLHTHPSLMISDRISSIKFRKWTSNNQRFPDVCEGIWCSLLLSLILIIDAHTCRLGFHQLPLEFAEGMYTWFQPNLRGLNVLYQINLRSTSFVTEVLLTKNVWIEILITRVESVNVLIYNFFKDKTLPFSEMICYYNFYKTIKIGLLTLYVF